MEEIKERWKKEDKKGEKRNQLEKEKIEKKEIFQLCI